MALSPIAFIAPNYRDFKTDWLKAYEPGTDTPKPMALDSTGAVTVAKLQLNADGFIVTAGDALVIPYLNGAYDLWLFPTEADADANDTSNAIRLADDILGVLPDAAIEDLLINDLSQVYEFATVAEYKAFTTAFPTGKVISLLDRSADFTVISGTGTATGYKIIASDQVAQSIDLVIEDIGKIYTKHFGAVGDFTTDDSGAILAAWDAAEIGSSIFYGYGTFRMPNGVNHPLKLLNHYGVGNGAGFPASAANVAKNGGSILAFTGTSGTAKGGVYMPPSDLTDPFLNCRFSSFNNMTFLGNGASDATGTNLLLKINNNATHLNKFTTRYSLDGIEVNYMVGARWTDLKVLSGRYSYWFVYDVATPYQSGGSLVTSANCGNCSFENVMAATPAKGIGAIGWYVDATNQYGANHHSAFDMEQCTIGAKFEGRIASKDGPGLTAVGASGWQAAGNSFDSMWFELNSGDNLVLSYDPGLAPPSLEIRSIYQDVNKITASDDTSQNMVWKNGSFSPLLLDTTEKTSGKIGTFGNPFTAAQWLINGPEINTPLNRSLLDTRVPYSIANRPSENTVSTYEFDVGLPNTPLVGAAINVASIMFGNPTQSCVVEVTASATDAASVHHMTKAQYLVSSISDVFVSTLISEVHSGAVQPLSFQGIRTSVNTFGFFVWKDATLTSVTNTTYSFKVVIGGSSGGGFQSNLNVLV